MNFKYTFILLLIFSSCCHVQLKAADFSETVALGYKFRWFIAAKNGNLEIVKELASKVDINAKDISQGNLTVLHFAAAYDYPAIVEFLLKQPGIIVNAETINGFTPLMLAVRFGWDNIIKLLLPRCDINTSNQNGMTPFLIAAENGRIKTIELLLKEPNIEIYKRNKEGFTALMLAAFRGHKNVFKLLLNMPGFDINDQNNESQATLLIVTAGGHNEIVSMLLEIPGINIVAKDVDGFSALDLAKQNNNRIGLELIRKKINELSTQAFNAIKTSNLPKLKSIVGQIGTDGIVHTEGKTLIDQAFAVNNPEIVLFLLNREKDPRELLARFPFELTSATSILFELCMDLAYAEPQKKSDSQIDTITAPKSLLLEMPEINLVQKEHRGLTPLELAIKYSNNETLIQAILKASSSPAIAAAMPYSAEATKGRPDGISGKSEQISNGKLCAFCFKADCTKKCASCKKIFYCSPECQKQHWAEHKAICKA